MDRKKLYHKRGGLGMGFTAKSILCSALLGLLLLGGCGIKPGSVSAPPSVGKDAFPHTYPDPATDPHP